VQPKEPISQQKLNAYDDLYSSSDEEEANPDVEASLVQAVEMGTQLHNLKLSKSALVAEAFDTAFEYIDELARDFDFDDTTLGRKKKADRLRSLGKATTNALLTALTKPAVSEYNVVVEHVIPLMVERYGKLFFQSNEQGQESAGQMIKSLLRHSANKRRKVSDYFRRTKSGELKLCHFKKTATIATGTTYAMKQDAMHNVDDRFTQKKRGGKVRFEKEQAGIQVKRDKVVTATELSKLE
jgi:hypothetical protein